MKTPMQELIDKAIAYSRKLSVEGGLHESLAVDHIIDLAESFLEKEKAFYWLRPKCDWCNGNNSPHMPQDTDGCGNDRSKCSCKNWGGCPVD